MNEIQIFKNDEFGEIRTVELEGEAWFIGKDVTNVLGYSNHSKALNDHVDADDKLNNESLSSLGQRGGWLINESGLYSLILSSKLPTAKKFKHWVTSEVLPSVRKHGAYMNGRSKKLNIDHAITIARIIADAPAERISMIEQVLLKAGVTLDDVEKVRGSIGTKKRTVLTATDTEEFLVELTRGRTLTSRGYLIPPVEFDNFCTERGLSPRLTRRLLFAIGYIEGSPKSTKVQAYSVPVWLNGEIKRYVVVKSQAFEE